METLPIIRILKTGFTNLMRNFWLSATATIVMVVTLVILSTLLVLFGITDYSVKTIQEKVDISVYFKNGLSEDKIMPVKNDLESDPNVKSVVYTSAAAAFDAFKQKHANDPLIKQSLDELSENPLPATLNIKAVNLDYYPKIAEKLNGDEYKAVISKINFEDNRVIIDRLSKILHYIITFGSILVGIFILIAILVIFNTITLTIYNRKEEVEIMRLVGATNWYIQGPFLAESFYYSIFSTIITAIIFLPVFNSLLPKISAFVNPEVTILNQNIFNFWYLVVMLFVVSFILSTFSTFLAIRKYLRI